MITAAIVSCIIFVIALSAALSYSVFYLCSYGYESRKWLSLIPLAIGSAVIWLVLK